MGWCQLVGKQIVLITKRNYVLQRRSPSGTVAQLAISIVMLLMLLIMRTAIEAQQSKDGWSIENLNPKVESVSTDLACRPASACHFFVYSGGSNAVNNNFTEMDRLVARMKIMYPKLSAKKAGDTPAQMHEWIRDNKNTTHAMVIFENSAFWSRANMVTSEVYASNPALHRNKTREPPFSYTMAVNGTRECRAFGQLYCNDPNRDMKAPLQTALDSAFLNVYGDLPNAKITASFSDFPHPLVRERPDVVRWYGTAFIYIAIIFGFVVQLSLIVEEKELHLRESMKLMGLTDTAYWISWFIYCTVMNTLNVLFLIICGHIFGLEFFTENAFGLYMTTFWLTTFAFTGFAFLISTFIHKSEKARLLGLGYFFLTYIVAPSLTILWFFPDDGTVHFMRELMSVLFPAVPYWVNMQHFKYSLIGSSSGVTNTGMLWVERTLNQLTESDRYDTFWSFETSLLYLTFDFFLCSIIACYLDKVLPTEYGRREAPWFFLDPRYWMGKSRENNEKYDDDFVITEDMDGDVKKEAEAVLSGNYEGRGKIAVELRGLTKTFQSIAGEKDGVKQGCCEKMCCPKKVRLTANKGIAYAIEENSLFVLLGHNGAGKTTCFNMMTGLMPVSKGDVKIFGKSIRTQMAEIQQIMGVCPQHDVLWGNLTGREHLELFARIKGIPEEKVAGEVQERLQDVLLVDAADVLAGSYSGGMRRRLSIAIALIGDPKIVFLDEPTTGMDPVTRREVWDMIEKAKAGRVVLLTTHSMEEADVLGDRIAVMSHGQVQAIGSSIHLKQRFGEGFRLTMLMSDSDDAFEDTKSKVKEWMDTNAPAGTRLAASIDNALLFQLPRQENALDIVPFFKSFEAEKDSLGIEQFSVGLSTLEEVFLNLSHKDNFLSSDVVGGSAAVTPAHIQVTVPDEASPGETLTVQTPEKTTIQVQIPEGATPGTTFTVAVPSTQQPQQPSSPDETAINVAKESERDAFEKEGRAKMKFGLKSQARALLHKSWTYQLRNKGTCCAVTFFPMVIMLALVLVQKLVLDPLVTESMCGERKVNGKWVNVPLEECISAGVINISAIKIAMETMRPGRMPTLDVGTLGEFNRNCNSRGCYDGLEISNWDGVPMTVAASVKQDVGSVSWKQEPGSTAAQKQAFKDWYFDLLYRLWDNSCDVRFNAAYDETLQCTGISSRTSLASCEEKIENLNKGRKWLGYNTSNTPEVERELDSSYKPSAATISEINAIQAKKDTCNSLKWDSILNHYSNDGTLNFNLTAALERIILSASSGGMMKHYSSSMAQDKLMADNIWSLLSKLGLSPIVGIIGAAQQTGLAAAPISAQVALAGCGEYEISVIMQLNVMQPDLTSVCEILNLGCLSTVVNMIQNLPNGSLVNMCMYARNPDKVRYLAFKDDFSDPGKVQDELYSKWGGSAIQTPYMKERHTIVMENVSSCVSRGLLKDGGSGAAAKSSRLTGRPAGDGESVGTVEERADCEVVEQLANKGRFFSTIPTAVAFEESTEVNKGKYRLRHFFNNSGSGARKTGNWVMLEWLANNAIIKYHVGRGLQVFETDFPKKFECNRDEWVNGQLGLSAEVELDCPSLLPGILRINILDFVGWVMMPQFLLLHMIIITNMIVGEKQNKLRFIMKMHGLESKVYWGVTYAFYYAQYSMLVFVMWLTGGIAGMNTFTAHSPAIVFLYFFLWGHLLIVFSFVLSIFFKNTRESTAMTVLLLYLFTAVGSNLGREITLDPNHSESDWTWFMLLLPPFIMIRGMACLAVGGGLGETVTLGNMYDTCAAFMPRVYEWMIIDIIYLWILLLYLEKVVVAGYGVRNHPLFCLKKSFISSIFGSREVTPDASGNIAVQLKAHEEMNPPDCVKDTLTVPNDVKAEHKRVTTTELDADGSSGLKVRTVEIHKRFPSKSKQQPDKIAVQSVSLGVNDKECFGLLGHNGAGKTTLINMLCGMLEPTSGFGVVDKYSLSNNGFKQIYPLMGVCPQHNILWPTLTAKEHLQFFGRLKGLTGKHLDRAVDRALKSVNLGKFANLQSKAFSGGMKRRLSVANSLMGYPSIVYMDEPSTGLDPASRRQLWNVISEAKGNKSIVLTTHSMEEADVLCDRVGIMANGMLQCLGTSTTLKLRFGVGYMLTLSAPAAADDEGADEKIRTFVSDMFPSSKLLGVPISGKYKYTVVREEVVISEVLEEMETNKEAYGIDDWSITETTLEEVFLKLAKLSHMNLKGETRSMEELCRFGADNKEKITN